MAEIYNGEERLRVLDIEERQPTHGEIGKIHREFRKAFKGFCARRGISDESSFEQDVRSGLRAGWQEREARGGGEL